MFLTVLCVLAAAVCGFALGRISVGDFGRNAEGGKEMDRTEGRSKEGSLEEYAEGEEGEFKGRAIGDGEQEERAGGERPGRRAYSAYEHKWRGERRGYEKNGRSLWEVGSPLSGTVIASREGDCPFLVIQPRENKLYAPVGGKITRLFPMGNAFRFTTEFGAVLYFQVGNAEDELLNCHFRPRVIGNEVVNKGKLLLEFDKEALEAAGESGDVLVRVESCAPGCRVRILAGEHVKCGEEIFEVCDREWTGSFLTAQR